MVCEKFQCSRPYFWAQIHQANHILINFASAICRNSIGSLPLITFVKKFLSNIRSSTADLSLISGKSLYNPCKISGFVIFCIASRTPSRAPSANTLWSGEFAYASFKSSYSPVCLSLSSKIAFARSFINGSINGASGSSGSFSHSAIHRHLSSSA